MTPGLLAIKEVQRFRGLFSGLLGDKAGPFVVSFAARELGERKVPFRLL